MKINHIVEYILFEFLRFIICLLPLQCLSSLARSLVKVSAPLLHSRKLVALKNLRNAFPEKSEQELNRIADESFVHIAITFLELLWFPRLSKEQLLKRVVINDQDLFSEIITLGRGAICLTAHFGNWELATQTIILSTDIPSYIIVKTQSNKLVDRKINKLRAQFGAHIVPMGLSIREIIRALQKGGAVFLAADQSAPKESFMVEFFGRPVPTFQGPAVFSLKSGAPIILFMMVRQVDGSYTLIMERVPSDDLKTYSEKNVLELTKRQVKLTEEIIRKYPEQWMWMHKRWKHVPDRT